MSFFFVFNSSFVFFFFQTPLVLGLLVVLQSIMVGVMSYLSGASSWFSYILIMIFVSGMMIIFLYISSLSSNLVYNLNGGFILLVLMTMFVGLNLSLLYVLNSWGFLSGLWDMDLFCYVYKLYSSWVISFTVLMMTYLLIVLFVVVKLSMVKNSPIRSFK
uniref:NADH dehydrogenase subunit 6 n=1 Tax=Charcotia amundseni TaxID=2259499 RepID=UPI001FF6D5F7|nr:NADH dehydrogenase subunit 6 [Charcotia amundseni]UIN24690.1 NADH dehydrogenase subunit 6 [Charcotia amundseni]